MKNLSITSGFIAGMLAYILGISAFLVSFSVPVMSNPETQANLVLSVAIIPAAMLGAWFYYRKEHNTHGFVLGTFMFLVVMTFDALITVPLFIIPTSGSHLEFFTEPSFWIIGLEFILAVVIYRRIQKVINNSSRTFNSEAGNR